jgi:hypothetical protein
MKILAANTPQLILFNDLKKIDKIETKQSILPVTFVWARFTGKSM